MKKNDKKIDFQKTKKVSIKMLPLKAILDNAPLIIIGLDKDAKVIFFNKFASDLTGYSEKEVLGKNWIENFIPPNKRNEIEEVFKNVLKKNQRFFTYENEILTKEGKKRLIRWKNSLIKDNKFKIVSFGLDITEEKKLEVKFKKSEEKYKYYFENISDVIYTMDKDFKITDISPSVYRYLGYKPEDIIGKSFLELNLLKEEYIDKAINLTNLVLSRKEVFSKVFCLKAKDGSLRWAEISSKPILEEGNISGVISVARDITEKVKSREELVIVEELYKTLFENLKLGIIIIDKEGKILEHNNEILKNTGYIREEFLNNNILSLFPEKDNRKIIFEAIDKNTFINCHPIKIEKKNKKNFEATISIYPIKFKGKNCLQVIIQDLTEIKKKELELKKEKEKFESFFMEDLSGNFISMPDGQIITCNPSFLNIFGFSSMQDEIVTNFWDLFEDANSKEKLIDTIKKEKVIEGLELKMKRKDGTPLHIIANLIGIFNEEGDLDKIQGYFLDYTKIKELEEHYMQVQKLEALGNLAGGIAHDFNNILSIIGGHIELLKKKCLPGCEGKKYVDLIEKAALRGISITKQLLTFSGKTEIEMIPCDLKEILLELQKLVFETFPKNINLSVQIVDKMPLILGDPTMLSRAILNLLVNAKDAMPDGGKIKICAEIISGSNLKEKFKTADYDNYIEISISDTGIGMDEKTMKRIFEPLFTTKESGKGTGLGLSMVYSIVKSHNGFVDVQSKIGKGTTFKLYLPIMDFKLEIEEEKKEPKEIPKGRSETLLIIEDEEMLLNLLKFNLQENGYKVLEAKDGAEGINIYREKKDEISCVICDMGLPILSGTDVFSEIRKINPAAKVILMSGLIDPKQKSELLKNGVNDIIQKPFFLDQVLIKLRQILDSI